MNSLSFYESIHGMIAEHYPPEEYPAENAFLLEKYASQPEPTEALEKEMLCCLELISRIEDRNPLMYPQESEAAGFQQYTEEFAEQLIEDVGLVFGAANCGL